MPAAYHPCRLSVTVYVVVFVNTVSDDSIPSLLLPTMQDSVVDTCTKGETPLAKAAVVATWFIVASLHVEVVSLNALCRLKEGTDICYTLHALSIGVYNYSIINVTYTAVNTDEEELLVARPLDIP